MKTWNTIDKSDWGEGAWKKEPDKAHWVDKDTGLDCLIVRGGSGALCGYVGVPQGHPYYKKDYDDVDVNIHGGLTFSGLCDESGDPSKGICHEECDAANNDVWWLGFDCAHLGDLSPAYKTEIWFGDEVYRDFCYVEREVQWLAGQLSSRLSDERGS